MENNIIKTKKEILTTQMAGVMSIGFVILSVMFHGFANAILAVIVGIFGVIKGDKLTKILSVMGVIIGIICSILFNPFQSQVHTSNGSVYSNSTYNFKITPPIGWLINSSSEKEIVTFADPKTPSDHPVIIVQLVPCNNLNLDDCVNLSMEQSKSVSGFSLISKEKLVTNSNDSYYLIESNLSNNTLGSNHGLQLIKQATNGEFFVITGTTENSVWDKYSTAIRNSLLSFEN